MMKPLSPDKLYYSIGEVAELFDVATSLIRYWESEFKELHPAKNSRGERKFTVKDIETIQVLYHLIKEKGFTIEGAKKEMEIAKKESKVDMQLLKTLRGLKEKILHLKREIE